MTYDHWKTTEPESGYDPPEETLDEANDRVCAQYEARLALLQRTAREYRNECARLEAGWATTSAARNKYEAALRKIAAWQGYKAYEGDLQNDYERGVNDMLATLKQMVEEALA